MSPALLDVVCLGLFVRDERASTDEPLEQIAVRGKDIDESIARPRGVIVLAWALLGEGHKELAADVVNPERGEARRDGRVGEAVDEVEMAVKNIDRPEAE